MGKRPTQASLALEEISVDKPAPPITVVRDYLTVSQQNLLLQESDTYPYQRPQVQVFGKKHIIPRSQVWFGDEGCDIAFSGIMIQAQAWPYYVNRLRMQLQRDFGINANGVLVNHYADGEQSMGWHSDDEPEFVPGSDIASISIGASRDFVLRHKATQVKHIIELSCGDLLIMHWPMQQQWEHALPKRLKVKEPRINFTFRQLTPFFFRK
ncbi:alpha-ketoglutarate-dependent dioxygenase AlkB family protein [Shewanella waksmanii]|uniref:alpha-ketoglutarate-dependent dioxygenase AlkB family protein n=1 Tax=Shewanella waksmanii TaxID=213783 RepID=UPI0037362E44